MTLNRPDFPEIKSGKSGRLFIVSGIWLRSGLLAAACADAPHGGAGAASPLARNPLPEGLADASRVAAQAATRADTVQRWACFHAVTVAIRKAHRRANDCRKDGGAACWRCQGPEQACRKKRFSTESTPVVARRTFVRLPAAFPIAACLLRRSRPDRHFCWRHEWPYRSRGPVFP